MLDWGLMNVRDSLQSMMHDNHVNEGPKSEPKIDTGFDSRRNRIDILVSVFETAPAPKEACRKAVALVQSWMRISSPWLWTDGFRHAGSALSQADAAVRATLPDLVFIHGWVLPPDGKNLQKSSAECAGTLTSSGVTFTGPASPVPK
jgi:hypothetical protein